LLSHQLGALQSGAVAPKGPRPNSFRLLLGKLLPLLLLEGLPHGVDYLLHERVHVAASHLRGVTHSRLRRHLGGKGGIWGIGGGKATKAVYGLLLLWV
jgi:hypothetical protein